VTSPRLALALRNLVVLAAPAACAIENPGFMVDPSSTRGSDSASTSTDSTRTGTDSASSTAGTDAVPTTTVSTLPADTTTLDPTTLDPTQTSSTTVSPDTGVDCVPMMIDIPAEADGFYIAGGTMGGTTCDYAAKIQGSELPCKDLNFGITEDLRLARSPEFDAMYVVRLPKSQFMKLKADGVSSATAELHVNAFAAPPEVTLRVGKIKDQWLEGAQDGSMAQQNDSSFQATSVGVVDTPWSDPDGPRGASTKVTTLFVPSDYPDATFLHTGTFPIDDWLDAPEQAEGLVVSFFKGDGMSPEGPSFNTLNHPDLTKHPFLRVQYCMSP